MAPVCLQGSEWKDHYGTSSTKQVHLIIPESERCYFTTSLWNSIVFHLVFLHLYSKCWPGAPSVYRTSIQLKKEKEKIGRHIFNNDLSIKVYWVNLKACQEISASFHPITLKKNFFFSINEMKSIFRTITIFYRPTLNFEMSFLTIFDKYTADSQYKVGP